MMLSSPLETDARFRTLKNALASYRAQGSNQPPILDVTTMRAAVAIVLRASDPLEVLLVKRATSDSDPWSGNMALPGGRYDNSDPDLISTAKRETMEEVGVDLDHCAPLLGRLDDMSPSTHRLPVLSISPFVFGVSDDRDAYVASPEIGQVFWVQIEDLMTPENHRTVEIPLPEGSKEFPCFSVEGEHVWGLTYRILSQFLDVLKGERLKRSKP